MKEAMAAWEGEGGALRLTGCGLTAEEMVEPRFVSAPGSPVAVGEKMIGTVSQVDWAEQIKARVNAEFDRMAEPYPWAR